MIDPINDKSQKTCVCLMLDYHLLPSQMLRANCPIYSVNRPVWPVSLLAPQRPPSVPEIDSGLSDHDKVFGSSLPHIKVYWHPRFAVSAYADNHSCSIHLSACMTQKTKKRDAFRHVFSRNSLLRMKVGRSSSAG
jgi:hypothetical protein